jgi:hypothetical protein
MTWNADEFAYATRGGSARVRRGFDCADIAAHEDRHVARADVFLAEQRDVGGFDHCISRFDGSDKAFGFDHS